jgi:plasmid stabilization system protein ParE
VANSVALKYHPEARAEVLDTVRWYLSQSNSAAIKFHEQLQLAEDKVRRNPELGSIYLHDCRIQRLGRFPYGIIYQLRSNYILVVAIAHLHRKPGYWKKRTSL